MWGALAARRVTLFAVCGGPFGDLSQHGRLGRRERASLRIGRLVAYRARRAGEVLWTREDEVLVGHTVVMAGGTGREALSATEHVGCLMVSRCARAGLDMLVQVDANVTAYVLTPDDHRMIRSVCSVTDRTTIGIGGASCVKVSDISHIVTVLAVRVVLTGCSRCANTTTRTCTPIGAC